MPVTRSTLAMSARQRREVAAILEARQMVVTSLYDTAWLATADEVIAYADAWADIMVEAIRARRRPNPARLANLAASRRHIEAQLSLVNENAAQVTVRTLAQLARKGEDHAAALVGTQTPTPTLGVAAWVPVDPRTLDAIIARTTKQITVRHYALSTSGTRAIRSALRAGIAAGSNPRAVARQMVRATEGVFNGGLARAEVIARTEILDAYRSSSSAAMKANEDLLRGWVWLCELSSRTCPSCLDMNGTEHAVDEPGPLDHHQGRCTSIPLLKSWRDLGLPGPEPKQAMPPDSMAWFNKQSEATQRGILGGRGYDAWKAGNYPPGTWAQRVETPEWRPAYHTRTPA